MFLSHTIGLFFQKALFKHILIRIRYTEKIQTTILLLKCESPSEDINKYY